MAAISLGNAVDDHCKNHDRQTGLQAPPDVEGLDADEHVFTQATGADHRGDHDHRQRHHGGLVDPGHDARQRQRQLHAEQLLPAVGTEGVDGFHDFAVDLANA